MNTKIKKRLCWNCEGNIASEDEVCPYCGVSVRPLSLGDISHTQSNLPPYRIDKDAEEEVPQSPYAMNTEENARAAEAFKKEGLPAHDPEWVDPLKDFKIVTVTIMTLLSGLVLVFFGTILLLFARDGIMTLSWDGTYWYVYLLLGIPLIAYGWRQLYSIKD